MATPVEVQLWAQLEEQAGELAPLPPAPLYDRDAPFAEGSESSGYDSEQAQLAQQHAQQPRGRDFHGHVKSRLVVPWKILGSWAEGGKGHSEM